MERLSRLMTQWRTVGLLAVCAALVWLGLRSGPDGKLHVFFLDVGQGDAIFIRTPDGEQILVDGGPSPEALLAEVGDVMPFWDRSLDLIALTHPDADHMVGLLALSDRYHIERVLDTQTAQGNAAWRYALGTTNGATNIARITAQQGMKIRAEDVVLTVLSPAAGDDSLNPGDNTTSLVLRLDYGDTSALLTGDAPQEVEAEMLTANQPVDVDILKVGHHGSKSSSSEAFIAAVSPEYAVIQVGAGNSYGLPAQSVLDRLQGIEVLRTDLNGRVEAVSDGVTWQVKAQRRP
jgi:competence protein ComEC